MRGFLGTAKVGAGAFGNTNFEEGGCDRSREEGIEGSGYAVAAGGGNGGEFDIEKRKACWEAKESMMKELTMSNLANSFALQQNIASGEDMKKAQEAVGASDDQMQLIGANTATLKLMYQQESASTMMAAGNLANEALDAMCE